MGVKVIEGPSVVPLVTDAVSAAMSSTFSLGEIVLTSMGVDSRSFSASVVVLMVYDLGAALRKLLV